MKILLKYLTVAVYKNKILLSTPDVPFQKSEWDFTGKVSFQEKTSVKRPFLENSSFETLKFVKLTDEHVNSLERGNGQRLEFYTLTEIEKLPLTRQASEVFFKFREEMQKLTVQ